MIASQYENAEIIRNFLFNLATMLKSWGVKPEDWLISNKQFFVPYLHNHPDLKYYTDNHIYIQTKAIPWQNIAVGRIYPPKGSKYFDDFINFIQKFLPIELYVDNIDRSYNTTDLIKIENFQIKQISTKSILAWQYNKSLKSHLIKKESESGYIIPDENFALYLHLAYLKALATQDIDLLKFLKNFYQNRKIQIASKIINNIKSRGYIKFLFKYPADPVIQQDQIMVVNDTTNKLLPCMLKAGGIISEKGGINCHAAIICREFNLAGAVGVANIYNEFRNGDYVEINYNHKCIEILEPFKFGSKINI